MNNLYAKGILEFGVIDVIVVGWRKSERSALFGS